MLVVRSACNGVGGCTRRSEHEPLHSVHATELCTRSLFLPAATTCYVLPRCSTGFVGKGLPLHSRTHEVLLLMYYRYITDRRSHDTTTPDMRNELQKKKEKRKTDFKVQCPSGSNNLTTERFWGRTDRWSVLKARKKTNRKKRKKKEKRKYQFLPIPKP